MELDTCTLKRDELKAKKKEKSKEYDEIEKKIKHVRNDIRKEEKQYAERAQLIGTTISCATVDPILIQNSLTWLCLMRFPWRMYRR